MPRIPAAELERLKQEVSLERLVEARGVKLRKKGKDLYGRCPFHEGDDTPSLVVTPSKNLWRCFGCGEGGDVIKWVQKSEGVSFTLAVKLLQADLPGLTTSSADAPVVKCSTVRKLPGLVSPDAADQELLKAAMGHYHQALLESPKALGYLAKRGLENAEMVEKFQLGFADRTLGYRLGAKNRVEGRELRERPTRLGVLRESGHEHLRGSLVVPLFDESVQVVQMYGRKVTSNLRKGTARHLYLPGPQRGVFNLEAVKEHREVILCEAILDALMFWAAGFRNVTTTYGMSGLPPDLWEAFRKYKTERVLIAYDRDDAGERAAVEVAKKLKAAGIETYRIQFPRGMDVNAYAGKVKPIPWNEAEAELREALAKRRQR